MVWDGLEVVLMWVDVVLMWFGVVWGVLGWFGVFPRTPLVMVIYILMNPYRSVYLVVTKCLVQMGTIMGNTLIYSGVS